MNYPSTSEYLEAIRSTENKIATFTNHHPTTDDKVATW